MIRREIVFSVLRPQFDAIVVKFRNRPTATHRDTLIAVAKAMECAKRRPIGALDGLLRNVPPRDYVKRICGYRG